MTPLAQEIQVWEREELLNGCQAVSHGVRLADVDVIAAYPMRPYTEVMDVLSKMIADGQLDAEYIIADSEHSQFEIVKHASSVGARAFAGSSGTGWMYGFEALVVTATDRLPPLFLVGNRALDDPGAFGVEHNDAMSIRDMGWLICWASTAQEALEHVLIGYRIAEDKRVRMPMALAMDGAFLTHSQHMLQVPSKEAVHRFLPAYDLAERRLHPDNPISVAPQVNEDWVMELRRQNWEAARRAKQVIEEAYQEFNAVFGSRYTAPFFSEFMTEDAEAVLIGIGAVCMPARTAVRRLREQGRKVGYDAPICQDGRSGGFTELLARAEVSHDALIDFPSEKAFKASDDVPFRPSIRPASDDIVDRRLVIAHTDHDGSMEGGVRLSVAAPIEAVSTGGHPRGGGDGTRAAELGKGGFRANPLGVIPEDN